MTIALRSQQVALVRAQLGGHVHEIVFWQTTPERAALGYSGYDCGEMPLFA